METPAEKAAFEHLKTLPDTLGIGHYKLAREAYVAAYKERDNQLKLFADWLDSMRNENNPLWKNMSIWGKENAFELMLTKFRESQFKKLTEPEKYLTPDITKQDLNDRWG